MAYRKKTIRRRRSHVRTTRRRSRRIGGIKMRRGNVTRILGMIAGAVIPSFVDNIKIKGEPIDKKYVGAGALVVGYLLPNFVKGDLVAGVADGLLTGGAVMLLNETGVLSGLAGIPVISGWQDIKTINGAPRNIEQPKPAMRSEVFNNSFRPTAAQIMRHVYADDYADGD